MSLVPPEKSSAQPLEVELRQEIQARDEFLRIAAHELLTPLTSVHLQLEGMLRTLARSPTEGVASGKFERGTRSALHQVRQLAGLIDELLDVSRITGGRLVLRCEEMDLSALCRAATARFAAALESAGCQLQLVLPGALCGCWDRARLEQVIGHLLANAIKYGPGAPLLLSLEAHEASARLLVRDRGIGISPEDQERIFGRFERAVSAHHYGGLGLGLWITRQIVEAHGGTVAVSSEPGVGSAFTVELPCGAQGRPPATKVP